MRIGEAADGQRSSPNSLWDLAGKRHDEATFGARAFAILGHAKEDELAILAEQQIQTASLEVRFNNLVALRKEGARQHLGRGRRLRPDARNDLHRRSRF